MKVSIVIINYNDKVRIGRAIESALNQTHKDCEVIVVDDGSDKEVRGIYARYKDIKLIQLERIEKTERTPSRARNAGIKHAKGEYICFLDSDNYYALTFVENGLKNPADVMFCDWEIVGLERAIIRVGDYWKVNNTLVGNYLQYSRLDHQCLLIKRTLVNEVGCYDERLPRSQDCDLIVRLMLKTDHWKYVNKTGFYFEKHEKDQMKSIASIHGKTLWTLKNNINIVWLTDFMRKSPYAMIAVMQGIKDFMEHPKWSEDYNKSDFKKLSDLTFEQLNQEIKEVPG